jgi:hypothetical protein
MMLISGANLVASVVVGIFVYGRTTERTKSNTEQLSVHTRQIGELQGVTNQHEGEIGQLYGHMGLDR